MKIAHMWMVLMLASLVDVSAGSGLTAKLENGGTPEKHLPETMVGGVALLDYDRDGKLDVFLANGAPQPSLRKDGPRYWNRLYRNTGGGQFVDVTERAGVQGVGFDIGAAAGVWYEMANEVDLVLCVGNYLQWAPARELPWA
ncbi:MAG: FG-GAP repeat domain-containing protein, partial [Acidobacteriota bacterium]